MTIELFRFYLLAVLLWGAQGKARAFGAFRGTLEFWLGLSPALSAPVGAGVIVMEAATGGALLAGHAALRMASLAALILLSLFTLLIAVTLLRGRSVHCSCFGDTGDRLSWYDILRNATLLGAAAVCLTAPAAPTPAGTGATLVAAGLGLLLAQIAAQSALIGRIFSR